MNTTRSKTQHLFLARHGRTALNAQDRLRGLSDPPLDEVGIAEAERLAAAMADRGITTVVSSPLQRAWRTAHVVALAVGAPHRTDPAITDRDYGPQTGRRRAEVDRRWGSVDRAPGVEPAAIVHRRTVEALNGILDAAASGAILVVTHDALVRAFLAPLLPGEALDIHTGSWNWLTRREQTWSVVASDQVPRPHVRPARR